MREAGDKLSCARGSYGVPAVEQGAAIIAFGRRYIKGRKIVNIKVRNSSGIFVFLARKKNQKKTEKISKKLLTKQRECGKICSVDDNASGFEKN